MVLSLKKAYLIWLIWAVVLASGAQLISVLGVLMSGTPFEKEYLIEESGWVQEGLLKLALVLIPTVWWPLLGTKTKESGRFFLVSLVATAVLLVLSQYIINAFLWLLSGGIWDPNATDAGFGAAGFFLFVFIPGVLIAYLIIGIIIRKRSIKRM
jgi:hypothetical protein